MRAIIRHAAAAAAFTLPSLAQAASQTQIIAFSGNNENSPYDVVGADFNPALGTLTGVSVQLTGSFTPDIYTPNEISPTQATLVYDVTIGETPESGSFATELLTESNHYITGAPAHFDLNFTPADIAAFIGTNTKDYLGILGFDAQGLSGLGAASDFSSFTGDFTITYAYAPVPEPQSLALLAAGAAALAAVSRRKTAAHTSPR